MNYLRLMAATGLAAMPLAFAAPAHADDTVNFTLS